jgi:putative Mg2+ transporter-C (MgtC) family protein
MDIMDSSLWVQDLEILSRVALAGGLGALIGLEREISDKPAGLRTHIFVASASALLMLLGDAVLDSFEAQGHQTMQSDPIRIIQAIVIGISFLGTGTIIHQSDRVEGLTTAASIFLTAGIGVAVAVERIVLAAGTAVFGLIVLVAIGWIEHRLGRKGDG